MSYPFGQVQRAKFKKHTLKKDWIAERINHFTGPAHENSKIMDTVTSVVEMNAETKAAEPTQAWSP